MALVTVPYLDCFFKTSAVAHQFIARLASSFETDGPHVVDSPPDRTRPVLVVVSEHDGSEMNERTVATLLANVNLYDGEVHDEPRGARTGRPGGAPFSNSLPQSVIDGAD